MRCLRAWPNQLTAAFTLNATDSPNRVEESSADSAGFALHALHAVSQDQRDGIVSTHYNKEEPPCGGSSFCSMACVRLPCRLTTGRQRPDRRLRREERQNRHRCAERRSSRDRGHHCELVGTGPGPISHNCCRQCHTSGVGHRCHHARHRGLRAFWRGSLCTESGH